MFNASQAFSLAIMAMNMPSWVAAQKEIMPEEKAAEVDEKELFSLFGLWSIDYFGDHCERQCTFARNDSS